MIYDVNYLACCCSLFYDVLLEISSKTASLLFYDVFLYEVLWSASILYIRLLLDVNSLICWSLFYDIVYIQYMYFWLLVKRISKISSATASLCSMM